MKTLVGIRKNEKHPENKSKSTLQEALIASEARYRRLFETAKVTISNYHLKFRNFLSF